MPGNSPVNAVGKLVVRAITTLELLIAFKAIGLVDDLHATERRVCAALLDHYNRKTGQCDPSLGTIATLLNLDRRTIIRSIQSVVRKGYFFKDRHGGKFHRNSYEPNWNKFQAVESAWCLSRQRRAEQKLSPSRCVSRHRDGDAGVTQTCSSNLTFETFTEPVTPLTPDVSETAQTSDTAKIELVFKALAKRMRNNDYATLIGGISVLEVHPRKIVLEAPSAYVRSKLLGWYNNDLTDCFRAYFPNVELDIRVRQ